MISFVGNERSVSRVTTELHSNTSSVGTLNEKTAELEHQLGTERERGN